MEKSHYISDPSAFAQCFDRYYARLCYFAKGLLPDAKEAAPDLVQCAFEKLWERREGFSQEESVRSFLYITVRNACMDVCKHDRVVRRYAADCDHVAVSAESVLERMMEAEVLASVYSALQQLPEGCRSVLNLGYFQGLKNGEIASRLSVSVNTVKSQKLRAIRLLRALFTGEPSAG